MHQACNKPAPSTRGETDAPPCYQERGPAPELRPWVECYWWSCGALARPHPQVVLPDTCMDLVFDLAPPSLDDRPRNTPSSKLVGTMTQPLRLVTSGRLDTFGIRFRPGALPLFVRVPAEETLDRGIPLCDLLPPRHPLLRLPQRLGDASLAQRVGHADQLLLDVLRAGLTGDRRAVYTAGLITGPSANAHRSGRALERGLAPPGVDAVARAAGVSRRTLERRIRDAVGVSPGVLSRIARFRRASDVLVSRTDLTLAQVAFACGYSDQPHLTREVRRWGHTTPARLRSRQQAAAAT